MPKIKEASSFNGTSWSAAIPLGADDVNVDITSATTDPGGGAVPGISGDTSTSLDSAAVTVSSANNDTDASAWTKFNRFRARVKNALASLSVIAIQDDTPTQGEKLWLDTSGEGLQIPQINDNIVSRTDTWSSHRISAVGIAVQDEEPLEDSKVWIDTDETTSVTVPDMDDHNALVTSLNQLSTNVGKILPVITGATNNSGYTLAVGDYFEANGTLYKAMQAIPAGNAWSTSSAAITDGTPINNKTFIREIKLGGSQSVTAIALDDTLCPQGAITAIDVRNGATTDGIPSVFGCAFINRRSASVCSILLIADEGRVWTRGYNGTGWSNWESLFTRTDFASKFSLKTFTIDCTTATNVGGKYTGLKSLTTSEIDGAIQIIPLFARKSGYSYMCQCAVENGGIRIQSDVSLEGVNVGVLYIYP